jgi:hypothetical protein
MQVLSGEQTIVPVSILPQEIQDLRALFSTYRLMKKQNTQLKNRIHSLLKEQLYGFTPEEIFSKKSRAEIRELCEDPLLNFQVNLLLDRLERDEGDVETLKERILAAGAAFMRKLSSTLLTQSLNHALEASVKLREWYRRLSEYQKAGVVRTGLRRRILTEIYQVLKKGEYHYGRDAVKHGAKMAAYKKLLDFYHRRLGG